MKNFFIFAGIILLIIAALGLGTSYWLIVKAKKTADSAVNTSTLTTASQPHEETSSLSMPKNNIFCKDLNDIPRYNASKCSNYYVSDDKHFTSIEYYAPDKSEKIIEYYKNLLQGQDWVITASDSKTVTFEKEGNNLNLEISAENPQTPVTQYSLNLIEITI